MDYKQTHIAQTHKHDSPLISCRFGPAGDNIFFAAEDYKVWRWNPQSDEKVAFDTEAWVRGLCFSKDGSQLITGGYDGRVIFWSVAEKDPKPIRTIDAHNGWVRGVAVSPDGATLASVGNDHIVRLWNVADGANVAELKGNVDDEKAIAHRSHIYNVAFHPNGKSLVTGDLMGQLIEWNIAERKPVRSWTAESLSKYDKGFRAQIGGFRTLQFNTDGSKLYASGITAVTNAFAGIGNPSIVEFNWADNKQLVEYLSKPKLQGVAWGVALHPENLIVGAHGGSNGHLMFWKHGEAEAAHQFRLPQNARDLDMHSDGLRLAVACSDKNLQICRMEKKAG